MPSISKSPAVPRAGLRASLIRNTDPRRVTLMTRVVPFLTSADEHAQTSVSEHGDRHSPRPAGGPGGAEAARRVAQAGRPTIRRQNPSPFPRARHGRSLPRCGELAFRTPTRHRAPKREPGRILIPGDGAAGDQGAQNRPARQWRLSDAAGCPVSTSSWHYGPRRTCRLVTGRPNRPRSTGPDQARLT